MAAPKQTTPALTKDRICQTAISIADQQGLASLSMRKLAKELGVEAMSLYHHVKKKEEIFALMVDEVFREIKIPSKGDWKVKLRKKAETTRDALLQHPWALGIMDSQKEPGPATLNHHNTIIGIFKSAGFSIKEAANGFSLIDSYTYGFVLQEMSLPLNNNAEVETVATSVTEQMPVEDDYPYLMEMMIEYTSRNEYDFAKDFAFGLDLILDGLDKACGVSEK